MYNKYQDGCREGGTGVANESKGKISRVLGIYTKLINGCLVRKEEEAVDYGVNERSIQRDIEDIRRFLEDSTAGSGYAD